MPVNPDLPRPGVRRRIGTTVLYNLNEAAHGRLIGWGSFTLGTFVGIAIEIIVRSLT